jgi:hypothetical protein
MKKTTLEKKKGSGLGPLQGVECLPSMLKALSSICSTTNKNNNKKPTTAISIVFPILID